jgi:Carboxypeptidase regulatory-like domain/Bacterial Ig-like domain (group 2)
MTSKWALVLAALLCLGCDEQKPPTVPSEAPGQGTRVTLVAPHPTLAVGESQQLSIVITGPTGVGHPPEGVIVWRSSNDAVYVMWAGGLAVAVGPGQATISAIADGRTVETSLRVEPAAGVRRLQGRVTDFTSDAPLAGVTVGFGADVGAINLTTTTDASGNYALDVPAGPIYASIDGEILANLAVRIGGPAYRGDLLGKGGVCMSRYGLVTDGTTFQPVAGATVRVGGRTLVTGPDGWYRIDLGCDDSIGNFSTAFMYVSHPAYRELSRVLGRGIHRVNRIDAELQRQ